MSVDIKIANSMLEESRYLIHQFRSVSPSEMPYLIILGGQPGSGKSTGIQAIEKEERFQGNVIPLSNDDFKPMYPGYISLLSQDPIATSYTVQPYANYVVDQLKKELSDKKYNLIIEGTMRTSEVPLNTLNEFKKKGYQTEAYVIAANYFASRAGCLIRRETEILRIGHGRAVPVESHDAAYNNIPDTLNTLIRSGKLDNLTVLSRNGEVVGNLTNGDEVVSVYLLHRSLLNLNEFKQIKVDLDKVVKMMRNRGAAQADLDETIDLQNQIKKAYPDLELNTFKYTLTNEFGAQYGINSNYDILDYFRQKYPVLVSTIEQNGVIEVKGHGSLYLSQEHPPTLAKLIAKELNLVIECAPSKLLHEHAVNVENNLTR
jgi:UDP-N-acetylglucosamine kinase